jgi:hypothetical protein
VICGFDYDNVISYRDGCELPLRDPLTTNGIPIIMRRLPFNGNGKRTIETFEKLNDMGITWFILTSRLKGLDANSLPIKSLLGEREDPQAHFNSCIRNWVDHMRSTLPPLQKQTQIGYKALYPDDVLTVDLHPNSAVIYKNIIFAGGEYNSFTDKGRVIESLMAQGTLPQATSFDYFLFVDNDLNHINSVIKSFRNIGSLTKLIAIHYPQTPLLDSNAACEKLSYKLIECFEK